MKLLLVDDDAFYVTCTPLSLWNVAIRFQSSKMVMKPSPWFDKGEQFDVLILDMVMPGMGGVELLKHLQKSGAAEGAKCIVLSNQGEESDIKAATDAGADGYIIKAESIPSQVVKKVESLVN